MPDPNDNNGWNEWSRHVLAELKRQNDAIENIEKNLGKISIDIAMLQVKAGVWGAIAGMIPVIIALIVMSLKKG